MEPKRQKEDEEIKPSFKNLLRRAQASIRRSARDSRATANSGNEQAQIRVNEAGTGIATGIIIFLVLWFLAGLAGFICSCVCLGYEGDNWTKFGGIAVAIILGPLYWIYFGILRYNGSYCVTKEIDVNQIPGDVYQIPGEFDQIPGALNQIPVDVPVDFNVSRA